MAVTDESLQEKRERLEKLQLDIAKTSERRHVEEDAVYNEMVDKQLDAQIAAAEAKLAREKRIANRRAVRAGAENIITAAKDDKKEAEAVAKADAKAEEKGK